jgi:Sigma-70 region 2
MQSSTTAIASRHLRDLFGNGTVTGQTDGQLLTHYATCNDGSAFEALVTRHGPMVVATCRAVLKHEHDIEDAFQATFWCWRARRNPCELRMPWVVGCTAWPIASRSRRSR